MSSAYMWVVRPALGKILPRSNKNVRVPIYDAKDIASGSAVRVLISALRKH